MSHKRITPEMLVGLLNKYPSYAEDGKSIGISRQRVHQLFKKHGIKYRLDLVIKKVHKIYEYKKEVMKRIYYLDNCAK